MTEQTLLTIVGSLGFPIAVCAWFMFRFERKIDENTAAYNAIANALTRIHEVIDKCPGNDKPGRNP